MVIGQRTGADLNSSDFTGLIVGRDGGVHGLACMFAPVIISEWCDASYSAPSHDGSPLRIRHEVPASTLICAILDGLIKRDIRCLCDARKRIGAIVMDDVLVLTDEHRIDNLVVHLETWKYIGRVTETGILIGELRHLDHDGRVALIVINDSVVRAYALDS